MREVLADVDRWQAAGDSVALATVVRVWGSAPRPLGAKMAISSSGGVAGSVSGGCVEGAVIEQAQEVLAGGPARRLSFGVSDELAWSVGLSCGGQIEVYVEPWIRTEAPELSEVLARLLRAERLVAVVTVLPPVAGAGGHAPESAAARGGAASEGRRLLLVSENSRPRRAAGDLGDPALEAAALAKAGELLRSFQSQRFEVGDGGPELFVDVLPPRPQLLVVGAVHTAIPLVTFANALGFHTVVIDPRGAFATAERFAHADRLLARWPQEAFAELDLNESTYVALLSHDLKLDLPALRLTLASPARYIGALGSRKTAAKRAAALADEGFSEEQIARIHAPIGLDLGGRTPEEIAVSVIAEIVAVRHGRRAAS
jgi:xanthine dehydrogenase accessory factor